MGNLLVVIAVALFIAAIVVLVVAIRRPKTPATPGGRRDPLAFDAMPQFGPRQLGPGAIVSHGGIDYVVRGSVTFREGPFVWWEHLLEGGDTPTWLSVQEDDGRLELAMWVKRTDLGLQPGGQHVIDGVTFQETERGHAGYTTEGTTGLPAGGEMDYVDCASAGQGADESMLLSFERWAPDMGWEIATGKSVLAGELTVYPAPPVSASGRIGATSSARHSASGRIRGIAWTRAERTRAAATGHPPTGPHRRQRTAARRPRRVACRHRRGTLLRGSLLRGPQPGRRSARVHPRTRLPPPIPYRDARRGGVSATRAPPA